MANKTKQKLHKAFLRTENPEDIKFILLDEVEAVLVKRPMNDNVRNAIRGFDESQWNLSAEFLDAQRVQYMDPERLIVPSRGPNCPDGLTPLWQERRSLRKDFKESLRLDKVVLSPLTVQRARRFQADSVFHKDVCTGMGSKAEQKRNNFIYAASVHKGRSTEAIPYEDAGRPTPSVHHNRASFYHPRTLEHLLTANPGDLLVFKSGENGTVHRAPSGGRGLRWWSFMMAEETIHGVRRNFSVPSLRRELSLRM